MSIFFLAFLHLLYCFCCCFLTFFPVTTHTYCLFPLSSSCRSLSCYSLLRSSFIYKSLMLSLLAFCHFLLTLLLVGCKHPGMMLTCIDAFLLARSFAICCLVLLPYSCVILGFFLLYFLRFMPYCFLNCIHSCNLSACLLHSWFLGSKCSCKLLALICTLLVASTCAI